MNLNITEINVLLRFRLPLANENREISVDFINTKYI